MKISAALVATAATAAHASLQPIVMKGSKLFYKNGTQFFMKGVAYQQDSAAAGGTSDSSSYTDPLADKSVCARDVPLLKALGTNIIRTYAVDPTQDHSACMKLLDDAGIYVISDLSEPSNSINRDDPAWDTTIFTRYKAVIDDLSQYSNVVGFFAGNEVSNNKSNTDASAYVKAAVRDTKNYISKNKDRWLGVGYAANDDVNIRDDISQYFNCGEDDERIDYWGYNIYSWCGESSMQKSGYSDHVEYFKNYSVPVFFAEYGCNEPDGAAGRIFEETTALYSDEMTEVFSGGIVYMYFQEENDYGLVKVSNDKASKLADYSKLQSRVAAATPSGVSSSAYKPTNSPGSCPALSDTWAANKILPPTPDDTVCECMVNAASCVPAKGLKTKAYQDIFDYICGQDKALCAGINGNATTGVYGAYSMCTQKQKLAFVLDQYYKDQDSASSACDFDGQATTQDGSSVSSCKSALASASSVNAVAATATVADATSDSSSSASSSNDNFGNPAAGIGRLFTVGEFAIGAYLVAAVGAGAGMIFL